MKVRRGRISGPTPAEGSPMALGSSFPSVRWSLPPRQDPSPLVPGYPRGRQELKDLAPSPEIVPCHPPLTRIQGGLISWT